MISVDRPRNLCSSNQNGDGSGVIVDGLLPRRCSFVVRQGILLVEFRSLLFGCSACACGFGGGSALLTIVQITGPCPYTSISMIVLWRMIFGEIFDTYAGCWLMVMLKG